MMRAAGIGERACARGESPRGRLLVLTGEPGSGKSTRCRQVTEAAREAGLAVGGVVTLDEPIAGGTERRLQDVRTGERVLLGRTAPPEEIASGAPRWALDDAALEWCAAVLERACPADLLVIDEVGPVELVQRRGALPGVRCALCGPYGLAVVVVRPWLVSRFLELFPQPLAEVVDVRHAARLDEVVTSVAAGSATGTVVQSTAGAPAGSAT